MLTPATRIDAVNAILATIGSAPLVSLDTDTSADAAIAVSVLDEASRQVQTVGWRWNTDEGVTLSKDSANKIPVAPNVASIRFSQASLREVDPVIRGNRLWDRKNATGIFKDDLEDCTVVYLLDWEAIPAPARQYITIKACRIFAERFGGDSTLIQYTARDEQQALSVLEADEVEAGGYSLLSPYDLRNSYTL